MGSTTRTTTSALRGSAPRLARVSTSATTGTTTSAATSTSTTTVALRAVPVADMASEGSSERSAPRGSAPRLARRRAERRCKRPATRGRTETSTARWFRRGGSPLRLTRSATQGSPNPRTERGRFGHLELGWLSGSAGPRAEARSVKRAFLHGEKLVGGGRLGERPPCWVEPWLAALLRATAFGRGDYRASETAGSGGGP